MSVLLCLHSRGCAILISGEDLGYDISHATWGREAALTAAIGSVVAIVPAERSVPDWHKYGHRVLTRHVVIILGLRRFGIRHDCDVASARDDLQSNVPSW
jgi:hypothetical protein